MRHRNNVFTATLVALAFALAPVVQAGPRLDGGPSGYAHTTGVLLQRRGLVHSLLHVREITV
jgi:hypothetical protein